jgi:plasmid replication initiation protein
MKETNSKNLVVKSNKLIEASYRLSVGEQKILYKLITTINKNDKEFKNYVFNVSEFIELLDVNNPKKYSEVHKLTDNLVTKKVQIKDIETGENITTAWLSSSTYHEKKGTVTLRFDPILLPYLVQLKKDFTAFDISNVIQMRSCYSTRIYELLLQYKKIGNRRFCIKELRHKLGIEPEVYKLYADFKRYVILQSQKEINLKSNISFEFEEVKEARKKVSEINFIINTKKEKLNPSPTPTPTPTPVETETIPIDKPNNNNNKQQEVNQVIDLFRQKYRAELDQRRTLEMIESRGLEQVVAMFNKLESLLSGRQINSIAGYFYKSVMENYNTPTSYKSPIPLKSNIPQHHNFEQRTYTAEQFNNFFANTRKK